MRSVVREHAEPADVRPWGDAVLVAPLGAVITVSDPSDSDPLAEQPGMLSDRPEDGGMVRAAQSVGSGRDADPFQAPYPTRRRPSVQVNCAFQFPSELFCRFPD